MKKCIVWETSASVAGGQKMTLTVLDLLKDEYEFLCLIPGEGKLSEELKIEVGRTTKDGKFTLNATRCLGACGLAPVMMIGEEVYGRLTPDQVPDILAKY